MGSQTHDAKSSRDSHTLQAKVIHPILASHCQTILYFEAPAVWINVYKSLVSFIYRSRRISLYLFVGHQYLSIASEITQLIHFEAIGGY
jgi:hypothetical protein